MGSLNRYGADDFLPLRVGNRAWPAITEVPLVGPSGSQCLRGTGHADLFMRGLRQPGNHLEFATGVSNVKGGL